MHSFLGLCLGVVLKYELYNYPKIIQDGKSRNFTHNRASDLPKTLYSSLNEDEYEWCVNFYPLFRWPLKALLCLKSFPSDHPGRLTIVRLRSTSRIVNLFASEDRGFYTSWQEIVSHWVSYRYHFNIRIQNVFNLQCSETSTMPYTISEKHRNLWKIYPNESQGFSPSHHPTIPQRSSQEFLETRVKEEFKLLVVKQLWSGPCPEVGLWPAFLLSQLERVGGYWHRKVGGVDLRVARAVGLKKI